MEQGDDGAEQHGRRWHAEPIFSFLFFSVTGATPPVPQAAVMVWTITAGCGTGGGGSLSPTS
ncbi:hypothetical protein C2845_PM13G19030 [Panicum miliaceum]|uniref:Uncharacterized protein n=1 Tax=Panicum miliaceum TaxID=4540 RepID=A0A3L6RL12_PANMI|nr:hypothetical protein C2845_PM13G19030 [Panicum miliaceum]